MAAKIGLVCWVIVLLCLVLLQSPQMSPAQSLSLPVCELQGAGSSSPYSGEQVQTEGVVHLDLDDTSRRGFFLQHAACDPDPLTSDGIFVYLGEQGDWVASGDRVQVNGRVQEYYGLTEIASSPSDVSVLSHNNPLPIAVKFDPPAERAAGSAYLETLGGGEGMYLFPPGPCIPPGATSLICRSGRSISKPVWLNAAVRDHQHPPSGAGFGQRYRLGVWQSEPEQYGG